MKPQGFTFIEIIAVIIILSILMAFIIPKFGSIQQSALSAKLKATAGNMRSAASIFKSRTHVNGYDLDSEPVTLDGITGGFGAPYAAGYNGTSTVDDHSEPPEIFKAIGLPEKTWSYHIYLTNKQQIVIFTPKEKLNLTTPSQFEVLNTFCYGLYAWDNNPAYYDPVVSTETKGC
jgi:MSHA pilin protein MshA